LPTSASDAISPALDHAKRQLFKPFRFGQWTRLAFVGWLAGELSSGGGCSGFQIPQIPHQSHGNHLLSSAFAMPSIPAGMLAAVITILIAVGLALFVIFAYLNSMMRFVLFDSVVMRECRIRESWRRHTLPGFRYFLWQLGFALVMWAGIAVVAGIPLGMAFLLGWFRDPQQHLAALILGGLALFFLLFAWFVLALIVVVMTKDFVVPQMALEEIGAVDAWRRLLAMMKTEKWSYAGYIVLKFVLSIAAGIMVSIASFIAILMLVVLPFGGLGIFAVVAGKAAGMNWNVFTIFMAVLVGCIALAMIIYLVCLISVPVIVFFPAYSIYFFAARYPLLNNLLNPPPPISPLGLAPPLSPA
jgi:hypothetical protein